MPARPPAPRRWTPSRPARCRCLSPPTSQRAAWTSLTWRWVLAGHARAGSSCNSRQGKGRSRLQALALCWCVRGRIASRFTTPLPTYHHGSSACSACITCPGGCCKPEADQRLAPPWQVVINYSFPLTVEDYVHRIGRTGRAGKTGTSHTFFCASMDKPRAGAARGQGGEGGAAGPRTALTPGQAHVRLLCCARSARWCAGWSLTSSRLALAPLPPQAS